ncbi:hypothetical protein P43SY_008003 [Pythium insidiosum]|uniref:Uncharacterized protein n=1 Tax=Pythium insidiosum TaxID=114742 RepID=A0AAD5MGS5_PYTIN|nr:hypothetical protein P43SY_008003 [Pythium insidiosum]
MTLLSVLLEGCGLLGFTWWLLGRYRDAHVPQLIVGAVYVSWVLGFVGLLLLPIDIAHHAGTSMPPIDDAPQSDPLLWLWQALYWATFLMSWAILPFLCEFSQNGEFGLRRRILSSLRRFLLHWTILVAVALVGMGYLFFVDHFSLQGLLGLAMAMANTYGLAWLIVLLGFGFVEIPRSLWMRRHPERRLRALYFGAVQVHTERMEALFMYDDVVREVRASHDRQLRAESASIVLSSEMQDAKTHLLEILALVNVEATPPVKQAASSAPPSRAKSAMLSLSTADRASSPPTLRDIVALHRRVRAAQADLRCSEESWIHLCLQAEQLQQHIAAVSSSSGRARPPVGVFSSHDLLSQCRGVVNATQAQLERLLLPPLWSALSLVAAIGSVAILWGELTMSWGPSFSLLHILMPQAEASGVTELIVLALLVYMTLCVFTALFRLRSFGRYALRDHGNSCDLALLKTAIHQCRLQFSLSYNFLLVVNAPRWTDGTAFHQLWRHMQGAQVFGRDVSVYAPLAMVALVICSLTNVYGRVMKGLIGMEQYESLVDGDAEHEAQIQRGEQLVQRGLARHRRRETRKTPDAGEASSYGLRDRAGMAQALLSGGVDPEALDDSEELRRLRLVA